MTCRELADFIADYLSGELPPDVQRAFEHHLTLCPACVHYIAAYRTTIDLNRRALGEAEAEASDAPEDLVKAILAARRR